MDKQEYHRIWYQTIGRKRETQARIDIKKEVLTHYGNNKLACITCGESRLACLSIDHIDGNGCRHRKEWHRWGYRFYMRLKRDGFPTGYQTLCMNCQFIKVAVNRVRTQEMPKVG